jgi:hypothetical protein
MICSNEQCNANTDNESWNFTKLLWSMARTSCNETLIWCVAVGCKTGPDQNIKDDEKCIAIWINYSQCSIH